MDRARRIVIPTTLVALLTALLTACGQQAGQWAIPGAPTGSTSASTGGRAGSAQDSTRPDQDLGHAPAQTFAVGVRTVSLSRTADRPLPTTIWYPTTGAAGAAGTTRADAPVATGRFPLVLVSHGLGGLPEYLAAVTTRIAAAGFVVAAPTYPNTNGHVAQVNLLDVQNQPDDAFFVISAILTMNTRSGDPLAGHVDPENVAAAGHSAGGYTTAGMFAAKHDARLRAGVIVAGGSMGTASTPSAPILFVHGDKDPTVSYPTGRSAYDRLTWPKAFLTVVGGDHGGFLHAGRPGFEPAIRTITDFLRSALYRDKTARSRLQQDGTSEATRFEQQLS